jgi:hypothetical protein
MKSNFAVMFLIVLSGTISIAVFNPIIGPLSRDLGLSAGNALYTAQMAGPYTVCALLVGLTLLLDFARREASVPASIVIGGEAK